MDVGNGRHLDHESTGRNGDLKCRVEQIALPASLDKTRDGLEEFAAGAHDGCARPEWDPVELNARGLAGVAWRLAVTTMVAHADD
jgi:hypothetical protein